MARIHISNDPSGHILVSFTYNPLLVEKVKSIDGRRWHPVEKHWSYPNRDDILGKIVKVFGENEVQINPALKGTVPDLQTTYPYPPHRRGREREGVKELESPACPVGRGLSPKFV